MILFKEMIPMMIANKFHNWKDGADLIIAFDRRILIDMFVEVEPCN